MSEVLSADTAELADSFQRFQPDVVLVADPDAADRLLRLHPAAHVLLLAGPRDRDATATAVASGAAGFLTRDGLDSGFGAAVATALAGRTLLDQTIRRLEPGAIPLTQRELQVLRGMSQGRSNAEIGRSLYLSEDTIKTHARRLFRKLGVSGRAQAVAIGFRRGWVS